MAKAATLMTDTACTERLLGTAWPGYFNKALAEDMHKNMEKVGLPQWSDDDRRSPAGCRSSSRKFRCAGSTTIMPLRAPSAQTQPDEEEGGGGPPAGHPTTSAIFHGMCRP